MLDKVLKFLHKPKSELLICGDFNVNFLEENGHKRQLVLLLQSYNTFHTVRFPTRITETSSSAIDNIFSDHTRINSYNIISISNGLSDHDAQCLVINNFFTKKSQSLPAITACIVNKE
jgi:endonuclease/exonuclease/phosphatase family metal-dependent hydrolase